MPQVVCAWIAVKRCHRAHDLSIYPMDLMPEMDGLGAPRQFGQKSGDRRARHHRDDSSFDERRRGSLLDAAGGYVSKPIRPRYGR